MEEPELRTWVENLLDVCAYEGETNNSLQHVQLLFCSHLFLVIRFQKRAKKYHWKLKWHGVKDSYSIYSNHISSLFFIFSSPVHQFHTMSHILNHFLLGILFYFLVLGLWMHSVWTISLTMIPISKIQQDLIQLLKDNLWFASFCNKNNCNSDLKFRLLWLGNKEIFSPYIG